MSTHTIALTVNGDPVTATVAARRLLCDLLRDDLHLTGTKRGCETGVCGACSVLVDGEVIKSCLMLAVQADGARITTVEGLAPRGELGPLQRAFADHQGMQCGYCTPGFLMAATALLEKNPDPTEAQVREALDGNLCRCTGYDGIVTSILAAAETLRGH